MSSWRKLWAMIAFLTLNSRSAWRIIAPFGTPVVPEVCMMIARSPGAISGGSRLAGSQPRRSSNATVPSSLKPTPTTFSTAGQFPRAALAVFHRVLWTKSTLVPVEPMMWAISRGWRRVFTGTTTAPIFTKAQ